MKPQQKDNRLTIGQRIDVYEILPWNNFIWTGVIEIGSFIAGYTVGDSDLVHIKTPKADCEQYHLPEHVRKVGTLVVTKLKGEDGV